MFNVIRHFSSGVKNVPKNHYDSLGVTSKATQNDIKSAYYKLSMLYHPDKNQGSEEASRQFRDINSAYEVLGNVRLRKLYDRGLSLDEKTPRTAPDDDRLSKFYKSRDIKRGPVFRSHGFNPMYNFDEWNKAHYGSSFARDMDMKRRRAAKEQWQQTQIEAGKLERMVLLVAFFTILAAYLCGDNNDKVIYEYDSKKT